MSDTSNIERCATDILDIFLAHRDVDGDRAGQYGGMTSRVLERFVERKWPTLSRPEKLEAAILAFERLEQEIGIEEQSRFKGPFRYLRGGGDDALVGNVVPKPCPMCNERTATVVSLFDAEGAPKGRVVKCCSSVGPAGADNRDAIINWNEADEDYLLRNLDGFMRSMLKSHGSIQAVNAIFENFGNSTSGKSQT